MESLEKTKAQQAREDFADRGVGKLNGRPSLNLTEGWNRTKAAIDAQIKSLKATCSRSTASSTAPTR
jgi:hypothetical protein